MSREAYILEIRRFLILYTVSLLVKGTRINQKVLSTILNDLGNRKGLPELQQNNLCSFVDAFNPIVKDRFKKKHLTNAEYNWLLIQYFSKDIRAKYLNENIEYRKISSHTFLKGGGEQMGF